MTAGHEALEIPVAPAPQVTPINDNYFSPETLEITIDRCTEAQTAAEVDFLVRAGKLGDGARVLDVGCGAGRQSIALARRGFDVTGVEKGELYLAEARRRAAAAGVDVTFVRGDARDMEHDSRFDLAVSFYTAFGYHSDRDNAKVLHRIARSLVVGGRFVLDITNRDAVANQAREVDVVTSDGLTVVKENFFDPFTSRRRLEWTYLRGDRVVSRASFDHRVYSLHELVSLFRDSGLELEHAYQDVDDTPFSPGGRHLVLVARRTL
ncbi:class I SAM-dependent methyltransferase [Streptomyces sp. NRRL F-5123]|uniref:class I SAM-dependent methyltransferase n=1 Tax=Streptomyces sp. NRRL F-5123 TaxID=1463856 RepID=UPI00069412EC|nr:class I SAM-dependent methyltransferase [Streptomyces sp. NRRL F-5123]